MVGFAPTHDVCIMFFYTELHYLKADSRNRTHNILSTKQMLCQFELYQQYKGQSDQRHNRHPIDACKELGGENKWYMG